LLAGCGVILLRRFLTEPEIKHVEEAAGQRRLREGVAWAVTLGGGGGDW